MTEIPESIAVCAHLEELNISNNTLQSGALPTFLELLSSLRVIMADNCGIANISRSLAPLQSLHTLSLRHNNLRCLPSWLQRLDGCLEILLVNENPFYGAYADLVKPIIASSTLPSSTLAEPTAETALHHQTSFKSPKPPSLLEMYTENRDTVVDSLILSQSTHSPWTEISPASERSSFMSRARNIRSGMRRPSVVGSDARENDEKNSRVDSLLLADSGAKVSPVYGKSASGLKPMKSMGDLTMSQPSPQLLDELSAYKNWAKVSSRRRPSIVAIQDGNIKAPHTSSEAQKSRLRYVDSSRTTMAEMLISPDSSIVQNEIQAKPLRSQPGLSDFESIDYAVDPESSTEDVAPLSESNRHRKPSFFRKLSLVADKFSRPEKKKSVSVLRDRHQQSTSIQVEDRSSQVTLGKSKSQFSVPFFKDDMRSASDPLVNKSTSTIVPTSSQRNNLFERSTTGKSRFKANSTRPPNTAKPAPSAVDTSKLSAKDSPRTVKRRSYLMLSSTLPPLASPGPLAVTFSRESSWDGGTVSKAPILDDQTIKPSESTVDHSTPLQHGIEDTPVFQFTFEQRKAALAPLMAYLRDLDDLTQEIDVTAMPSGLPMRSPPSNGHSSVTSRRPSLADVSSSSSNKPGMSSGNESSRPDSVVIISHPSMPKVMKLKDNPVKREVQLSSQQE